MDADVGVDVGVVVRVGDDDVDVGGTGVDEGLAFGLLVEVGGRGVKK
jgi:hypothetical protein